MAGNTLNPDWEYMGVKLTLHNVILPSERLDPSPSALDNLDRDSEIGLRFLGCEFIQDAGILLKIPQVVMATGQVLFQRFYYSKSFVKCNYEHYSMACLYLAAKVEECPRRLRDIINVCEHMRQMREQKFIRPMLLDSTYSNLKQTIIKAERRILKELGFCVHGKHPHKLIILYLKFLQQENYRELIQVSWNYMNDSLRTDVFVRYYPETIACACIFLAARQLKVSLPTKPGWWEVFNVGEMSMQAISLHLLRMYARPRPNQKALEARVAELLEESKASAAAALNVVHPVPVMELLNQPVLPGPVPAVENLISHSLGQLVRQTTKENGVDKPNVNGRHPPNDNVLHTNSSKPKEPKRYRSRSRSSNAFKTSKRRSRQSSSSEVRRRGKRRGHGHTKDLHAPPKKHSRRRKHSDPPISDNEKRHSNILSKDDRRRRPSVASSSSHNSQEKKKSSGSPNPSFDLGKMSKSCNRIDRQLSRKKK